MHILAVDIETTHLDPNIGQILECGLVLYDTKTKKRQKINWLLKSDLYTGDAFCLALNKRIFDELKDPINSKEHIIWFDHLASHISNFLFENDVSLPVTITGKNVGTFDLQFLKKIEGIRHEWFHHRILDVGSLFYDPLRDNTLPSLMECKKRAGIEGEVTHKAVDDANDVIDLIEAYYKF